MCKNNPSYEEIFKNLVEKGLWPSSKILVRKTGVSYSRALEQIMNLPLFYSGKVSDLYYIGEKDGEVLLLKVMSDRVSVFDIPLSENINKKGVLLTQIVNTNLAILKKLMPEIQTAIIATGDEIFDYIGTYINQDLHDLAERSQVIALRKPHVAELKNESSELEWIFRNYLTGSLFKAYKTGEDPYGIELDAGLNEWHKFDFPIFTPTTKNISDTPVCVEYISGDEFFITENLRSIFEEYTKLLEKAGIILVDTKFEISSDSEGNIILIDEFLTPDTSRFILKSDFEAGCYNSLDKQVLRNWAKSEKIDTKGTPGEIYPVKIPEEVKQKMLDAYRFILDELKKIESML